MSACRITLFVPLFPALLLAQVRVREEAYTIDTAGLEYSVEHLTSDQSPEIGSPFSTTRSPRGFLWLGTPSGIARFDGYESKIYLEDPAEPSAALTNHASLMVEDSGGVLWVATPGGLKRLDAGASRFVHYRNNPRDSCSIPPGSVSALCVDRFGTVWIGTGRGVVARLDRPTAKFARFALGVLVATRGRIPPIFSLVEDHTGTLWANAAEGIFRYNRATDRFAEDRRFADGARSVGAGPFYSMTVDRKSQVWLGTPGQLLCYDTTGNLRTRYVHNPRDTNSIGNEWILQIEEDAFGSLWMVLRSLGITRLDVQSGRMTHYRFGARGRIFAEPPSLNQISTNVWFCTDTERFGRFLVRRIPVSRVVTAQPGPLFTSPSLFGVWSLYKDRQGRLWAGNWKEDLKCQAPSSVTAYASGRGPFVIRGLGPGMLFQTYQDPWGSLWFVTLNLLQRYDEVRQTLTNVALPVTPNRIGATRDGEHWLVCRENIADRHYLARWDPRTNQVVPFQHTEPDSVHLADGHVSAICEDADGLIWFGTYSGGLYSFNRITGRYHRYVGVPGDSTALKSSSIVELTVDSSGTMWIATHYGLHKRPRGSDRFLYIAFPWTSQGGRQLAGDRVRGMAMDRKGHLWFALLDGSIVQYDPGTQIFRNYGVEEGIPSQAGLSILYDRENDLMYAGGQGILASFHPDSLRPNENIPAVVLTSFKVFEKDVSLARDISALDTVVLAHADNHFSFSFSALDFTNPARNQYAYRLEGVDRDWVHSGRRRFVSYTNLDPGAYVFRVRGSNNNGVWNLTGRSLTIIISPPWWRTAWAYAGYILVTVGSLYAFWRYDRKRVSLRHTLQMRDYEARKMREVDQMKSAFFANISHEFRTPLTLILGPLDEFAERFKSDESVRSLLALMRRNGLRLLQLINQILDLSRMDAGKMTVRVQPLELVTLSRSLVMSFLSLADRRKIDLNFEPEEDEILAYADRDKFEKILTNLLSNAFKFTGEGGEVKVVLRVVEGGKGGQPGRDAHGRRVELAVSDTGVGIEAAHLGRIFDRFYQVESPHDREHEGTGIGLALTKELVELLRGEITVESVPGHGSTFVVRLPCGQEAWRPEEIVTEERSLKSAPTEPDVAEPSEGRRSKVHEILREPGTPVVLIVEDNADVRTYVRGFLEQHFVVEEAENGRQGLDKALEMGIDLVVSDVMMPVMDGVRLCRELKGDERTNHIPVVLLTARASTEGKLEGLDVGADDYVVKPFDARELIVRVKNLIDSRKTLWKKYHQQVTLGPENIPVTSTDERFLKRFAEQVALHVGDAGYDTEALAHDMCMSRMQLNRKLRALTGYSTHKLVREFRLLRAAEMLAKKAGNVSEVGFEVGFSDLSHFSRAFRERFGVLPSVYVAKGSATLSDSKMESH